MTADQDWLEQAREDARRRMRSEIQKRRASGKPLFTDAQLGVLHQQLRDRRAA